MSGDAFTQGIDPGGLTNDYEVIVLICYIMHTINKPMSFDDINYILQSQGIVNYFEYSQAVSKLLQLNHIQKDHNKDFVLQDSGRGAALTFEKNLPKAIKEKTIAFTEKYLKRKENEKLNHVSYLKVEDGYNITLSISDVGSDLLNMTLFVPTEEYCEDIKELFYTSPEDIYQGVVALLTGDKQAILSIIKSSLDLN